MLASEEIRALTGLRGVAAAYVVLYHLAVFKLGLAAGLPRPLAALATHGYLAVDLFFVLSGFVMALNYARRFATHPGRTTWTDFLVRRLARVWPLYAALTLLTTGATPPAQLAANLALVQSWGIADSIVGQGWSISTEWAAYLAFPLLLAACCRGSWRRTAASGALAAGLLAGLALLPTSLTHASRYSGPLDFYSGTDYAPLLRCLCGFTLGLVAWRTAGSPRAAPWLHAPATADLLALAALALLATPRSDIVLALLLPPLVAALAGQRGVTARLLGCGPLHWLGRISYALYLTHGLDRLYRAPLAASLAGAGPWAISLLALALLTANLAMAVLAHTLVEEPCRRTVLRLWRSMPHATPALPGGLA